MSKGRKSAAASSKTRAATPVASRKAASRQIRAGGSGQTGVPERGRQRDATGWASTAAELLSAPLGRELLADVLDAIAAVLRRERAAGQKVADAADAVAATGVDLMATAASVGSEVTAGAADASTRITAAAMDMAEAAAGALARAGTQAVVNMLPGGSPEGNNRR